MKEFNVYYGAQVAKIFAPSESRAVKAGRLYFGVHPSSPHRYAVRAREVAR